MRRLPIILVLFSFLLLAACAGKEEAEHFTRPEILDLEAQVKGHTAQLRCTLSSGRLDRCGFILRDGDEETLLEGKLSGDVFTATVSGLYLDRTYTWEAWVGAGDSEVHSVAQTLEAPDGAVPVPDPAFREYLSALYDEDGDGYLSLAECKNVREIEFSTNALGVKSLKGIEHMPYLRKIRCPGEWCDSPEPSAYNHYYISKHYQFSDRLGPVGTLEAIDVTKNPKLTYLEITNNAALGDRQWEIDLSNNPELEELRIGYSGLEFPDISHLGKLRVFESRANFGQVPDFSSLSALSYLEISDPVDDHTYSVDVSHCYDLETLIVSQTSGTVTGIGQNTKLRQLAIYDVANAEVRATLQEVIPKLTNLEGLDCKLMYLGALDVSNNTKLVDLCCRHNNLTQLDVSNNPRLFILDCAWNDLASVDFSNLPELVDLYADANPLAKIDVTHNLKLVHLDCSNSNLKSLDLSRNSQLQTLICTDTDISELDLSGNPLLKMVDCRRNYLATLNVSGIQSLGGYYWCGRISLYCGQNNDASGNNLLQTLYVQEGQQIPFITENRSAEHIPESTTIQTVSAH